MKTYFLILMTLSSLTFAEKSHEKGREKAEGFNPTTSPLLGDWVLRETKLRNNYQGPGGILGCPEQMRVIFFKHTFGKLKDVPAVGLREIKTDGTTGLRTYDRVDFINIDHGKEAAVVDMNNTTGLQVTHQAWSKNNDSLTLKETITKKLGYKIIKPIPNGSSETEQKLFIENGRLHYIYSIDGKVEIDCNFTKK